MMNMMIMMNIMITVMVVVIHKGLKVCSLRFTEMAPPTHNKPPNNIIFSKISIFFWVKLFGHPSIHHILKGK